MKFLERLFKKPQPTEEPDPALVIVFVPPLVTLLTAMENNKGGPLDEQEVLAIRDKAVCMTVRDSVAVEMEEKRGYPDIPPDTVWESWQAMRSSAHR